MSKVKEIWANTIGSVHGADVNQELCFKAAIQLAAYASELEKKQSDLDWLESEVTQLRDDCIKCMGMDPILAYEYVLDLIKARKEAKS